MRRHRLPKALHTLERSENLAESRCSRPATAPRSTLRASTLRWRTSELPHRPVVLDPDTISDHLYTYHDDAAVAHLFGVAAGSTR
jgi:glutamyl-tRNA reductase